MEKDGLRGRRVGFSGLGVMGASMAGHLLDAGVELGLHSRRITPRVEDLVARGGILAADPAELAERCDVVFTMLGYPEDVEQVYLGSRGLLSAASPGAILVDCTTSRPSLARRIHEEGGARGVRTLDVPVTGGDVVAREGTLSLLGGGEEGAFEEVRPLLERMGSTMVLHGGPGAGQRAKLVNQILVAASMLGICEAFGFALRLGLDPEKLFLSLSGGAAGSWSLNRLAPRMLRGDFQAGFYVKHFLKDLDLALEEARDLGMDTPVLDAARRVYGLLAEQGMGDRGTQALWALYDPGR